MDAYLVEMQSIGGLSGSPVFVHFPPLRKVKDGIEFPEMHTLLIGWVHGHFDVELRDQAVDEVYPEGGVNAGIGVVVCRLSASMRLCMDARCLR